jgi:hypothetical protein
MRQVEIQEKVFAGLQGAKALVEAMGGRPEDFQVFVNTVLRVGLNALLQNAVGGIEPGGLVGIMQGLAWHYPEQVYQYLSHMAGKGELPNMHTAVDYLRSLPPTALPEEGGSL